MGCRARADLLLVGSLPVDSGEAALRAGAELFGDLVFALPDGETGRRSARVGHETAELLRPHPDVEVVAETESPTRWPRHARDGPVLRIRDGVTELHWERWPRIDDAIVSYGVFRRLRERGRDPARPAVPGVPAVLRERDERARARFATDQAVAGRAFEGRARRELRRLTDAIPPADLAIQWDVCYEVLDLEGVLSWTSDGAWERFAGPVERLSRDLPEDVALGYHLCYGTFPEWPMYEARDMELMVRMAGHVVARSGRRVDWLHLAVPGGLRRRDVVRVRAPAGPGRHGDMREHARVVAGLVG